MDADRVDAVRALLIRAQEAHGRYEATELKGVYDQEWPRWYATFAVEHGIGTLLGHDVTADDLAGLLASSYSDFERMDPKPSEPWADYVARRIATEWMT